MTSAIQHISTPLQLAALFLILVAGTARLLMRSGQAGESTAIKRLVIDRTFYAALAALIVGTLAGLAGPVINNMINGDEVFHGEVLSTAGDPVPDASVDLIGISIGPTNLAGQIDINVPRNRVRKLYSLEVKAPGYRTSAEMTLTDAQIRNFEVRLSPAPRELVKSLEPSLGVGQFFGTPTVLATLRVENPGSAAATISEIRGTLTGSKDTFMVTPVAWSIIGTYGPFYPLTGPVPIMAGQQIDLRVVFSIPFNFPILVAKIASHSNPPGTPPCAQGPDGMPIPLTEAGFQVARDFAQQHFVWYPGPWTLQLGVTINNEARTFRRDFVLSPQEVAGLQQSVTLIRECLAVNLGAPFAQDGTLSNLILK